jgi:hypothetical protein
MRKYIKDLDHSKIKKFLSWNSDIRKKVSERILDDAYYWVFEEYLNGAKDVDYELFGRGEYFTVKDVTSDFMKWIDSTQRAYEWLSEDIYDKCKRANDIYAEIEWKEWEGGMVDDELQEEYESLKEEIGDAIYDRLKSEYEAAFDDDAIADAFSNYIDEFIPDYETTYVDTDTWEIHDTQDENDSEYGIVDDDLSEQTTFL